MSNEYKDWLEDLKNAPIGSVDHKRWLLMEYPELVCEEWIKEIDGDFENIEEKE